MTGNNATDIDSHNGATLPEAASLAPPVPSARVVRPATLAVGHLHAVLSRGAVWWGGGGRGGGLEARLRSRPHSASDRRTPAGVISSLHAAAAAADAGGGDAPSAGGRGLFGLGERSGRGSSAWAMAHRSGAGGGRSDADAGGGVDIGVSRKRVRSRRGGSGGGGGGSLWATGGTGSMASGMNSLDEFHANPRLRFQLLLREQGVVVTLFDAMEMVRGMILLDIWLVVRWVCVGMWCCCPTPGRNDFGTQRDAGQSSVSIGTVYGRNEDRIKAS